MLQSTGPCDQVPAQDCGLTGIALPIGGGRRETLSAPGEEIIPSNFCHSSLPAALPLPLSPEEWEKTSRMTNGWPFSPTRSRGNKSQAATSSLPLVSSRQGPSTPCTLGTPGGLKHCPRPGPTCGSPGGTGPGVAWASGLFRSTLGILKTAGKPAPLLPRAIHAVWGARPRTRWALCGWEGAEGFQLCFQGPQGSGGPHSARNPTLSKRERGNGASAQTWLRQSRPLKNASSRPHARPFRNPNLSFLGAPSSLP